MPKKKIITKKEIQTSLNTLPLKDFLSIIDEYSKTNSVDLDSVKSKLITDDLQNRLINKGINTNCPYCNSSTELHTTKVAWFLIILETKAKSSCYQIR